VKQFHPSFTDLKTHLAKNRKPDFNNLLKVLKGEKPDRFTLFEFFLNDTLYQALAGYDHPPKNTCDYIRMLINAFNNAGYDYTTIQGSDFRFPRNIKGKQTISLNDSAGVHDWASFEAYPWPDPNNYDYSRLEKGDEILPEGMKFIVWGNGGVLENVIALVGYENLCYMLVDEPKLVSEIFNAVGSRFVKYYEICAQYDSVAALISNDDWGFNTQTMLSIECMEKYVFPWHKKIVEIIHRHNKPAILHSCGKLDAVMDTIIDEIGFDAKHSYEDNIIPVEQAYEKWGSRITVLGGIDIDFICRSTPETVYNRAAAMLKKTSERGAYALGSGNSIPIYVPQENYLAMIAAAVFNT
jgi:uroporphyrinogen decarboxylase